MRDTTIAHLSDLHLADDFFWRSVKNWRWYARTDDGKLIDGLAQSLAQLKPDYVVISGDIVNKSTPENFERAATLLEGMLLKANVNLANVLIVPGNHDAPILPTDHEVFERLKDFVVFLKRILRQEDFSRKPRFTRLDHERRLCIVGLDSTLKVGNRSSQQGWWSQIQGAEGEVGTTQRQWFKRKLMDLQGSNAEFSKYVKIVVLHHHFDIAHTAASERFMQLLDRADVEAMLGECGVNLVLHGHKHHPHERRVDVGSDAHYTVIGAGATLCTIPGETGDHGNSFNFIRLRPTVNKIELERYRANPDREFEKIYTWDGQLFHRGSAGYTIETMELFTRITDLSGSCVDMNRRVGVVADGPAKPLKQMSFKWGVESAGSRITAFEFDRSVVDSILYEHGVSDDNPQARRGFFQLRDPLTWGMAPLDLWWTFQAERAFCMRRQDWDGYYPGRRLDKEGIEADMNHQAQILVVKVEFPRGFWPTIHPSCIDQNGDTEELGAQVQLQTDRLSGTVAMIVRKPKLGHRYRLFWDLP